MHLFIGKVRGGVSFITYHHAKANYKDIPDYDPSGPSIFRHQKLVWMGDDTGTSDEEVIQSFTDDRDNGYILEDQNYMITAK